MGKKLIAAASALCVLFLLLSPASALEPGIAVTTADWLNFRSSDSMAGRVIDLIPAGSEVDLIQDLGEWCLIEWNGTYGYVYSRYLMQDEPQTVSTAQEAAIPQGVEFGIILGDEVRFRKLDSLNSDIYGYFYRDVIVTVLDKSTQWTMVEYNGDVGYVFSQYVQVGTPTADELEAAESALYIAVVSVPARAAVTVSEPPASAAQSASASEAQSSATETLSYSQPAPEPEEPVCSADDIIATAKTCLGVPYRTGGTSMRGFDCSGFTSYVFAQNGISLSRTATGQYQQGTAVSKASLMPGDLVFFRNEESGPNIGHVGIYLGDGKLIHASSGAYKMIVIVDLDSSWFTTYYYGACRILS